MGEEFNLWEWCQTHYPDIKGNLKTSLLYTVLGGMMTAFHFLVSGMPWWRHAFVDFLFAVAMIWVAVLMWEVRSKKRTKAIPAVSQDNIEEVQERLRVANGELLAERAALEVSEDELRRARLTCDSQMERKDKAIDECHKARREALQKLKAVEAQLAIFAPLQMEALKLSDDILRFVEGLGPAPMPKYSWGEISTMPESIYRPMIDSGDVDYADACEYYSPKSKPYVRSYFPGPIGRSFETVRAKYALTDLGKRVEQLRNRFGSEGMDKESQNLALPVEGRFGRENAETIAATLWELAYKVRVKGKNEA